MNNLKEYILEKFKISKNTFSNNTHNEISYDKWITYLNDIGLFLSEERVNDNTIFYVIYLNKSKDIGFNISFNKIDKNYFNLSSIYLGSYNDKFDKKAKLTNNWWNNGYDKKDNKYLLTINNANTLKEKLEDIVNIAK